MFRSKKKLEKGSSASLSLSSSSLAASASGKAATTESIVNSSSSKFLWRSGNSSNTGKKADSKRDGGRGSGDGGGTGGSGSGSNRRFFKSSSLSSVSSFKGAEGDDKIGRSGNHSQRMDNKDTNNHVGTNATAGSHGDRSSIVIVAATTATATTAAAAAATMQNPGATVISNTTSGVHSGSSNTDVAAGESFVNLQENQQQQQQQQEGASIVKDLFKARQETTVGNVTMNTEAFQPTLPLLPDHDGEQEDIVMKRPFLANVALKGMASGWSSTTTPSKLSRASSLHTGLSTKRSTFITTGKGEGTISASLFKKKNVKEKRKDKAIDAASSSYLNDNDNSNMDKKYTLKDPMDSRAVSELVTYLVPKKTTSVMNFMDPSLAFMLKDHQSQQVQQTSLSSRSRISSSLMTLKKQQQKDALSSSSSSQQRFYNECLFVSRVHQYTFENSNVMGGNILHGSIHGGENIAVSSKISSGGIVNRLVANTITSIKGKRQKLHHVCITRMTNSILDWQHRTLTCRGVYLNGVLIVNGLHHHDGHEQEEKDENENYPFRKHLNVDQLDEEDDEEEDDDYSLLYNPHHQQVKDVDLEYAEKAATQQDDDDDDDDAGVDAFGLLKSRVHKTKQEVPPEFEQSSFPCLVFFEIHSDGTHPEIVQVLDLDQLVAIENVVNSGIVKLVFQNGVAVQVDCDLDRAMARGQPPNTVMADDSAFLNKNRFLWSLLQIHAILCTSVVERKMRMANTMTEPVDAAYSRVQVATVLPQIQMRNVDKAELQYIATVNGFLSENPMLCLLLERQKILARGTESRTAGTSNINRNKDNGDGRDADVSSSFDEAEEKKSIDYVKNEMDDIAYDMIMGNFNRLTLFFSEEEKQDAEEVLNTATLKQLVDRDGKVIQDVDFNESDTAGALMQLLQKRMRDLEAETCRRLIAWEDGKKHSISTSAASMLDTVEAQSLSSLFHTLDKLDSELENMEEWLADKAAAIKPLTDECRKVEEVNRQLEQQKRSLDLLSDELERLLGGLELEREVEVIIKDPSSKLTFMKNGDIDLSSSGGGVQEIYNAGKVLKMTFDKVFQEGGIHLRAVNERAEGLSNFSTQFCQSVADIIVSIMRRAIVEATKEDEIQGDKTMNHVAIAKSIRNTQRRFQTSLLSFIKLIEVLALLKPSILNSVRESYAEIVAEGVLSKKRLKSYFDALPGKTSAPREIYTIDLSNYQPVTLRSSPNTDPINSPMKPTQAKGVDIALSEILPVIAREAYFTAALFGLSAKHLSGREKKQNFESAKKSVDYSSRHFKYFITRICGIASDADDEGRKVFADPMLCLVSSIYLNEAMDNYIDRQRKGGEHSLSLAYVRATILDLRKKVDKQWVAWIEEQIKWVHTNPGVPLNGKRAGIFTSFARFPSYLDHVMICCKVGRPKDQIPNLSRIKVITYYLQKLAASLFNSLHECSERESTDQQYAANVMRMENSYFFTQTIKQRGPELVELFQKQITAASSICKQSTDAYLGFMIKREFKSLHTLFASISRIRREVGDLDVPIHVPRSTFEKTLSKESNKEILKEKIGTIYYRMEKHLSEAGGLLPVAWKALVKVLYEWFGRWEKLSSQCYKFSLEPSASDVVRIAKQAAGISAKKINEEKSQRNKMSSTTNY